MADAVTPIGLLKIEEGKSANTWGAKLNSNADVIDSAITANTTAISAVQDLLFSYLERALPTGHVQILAAGGTAPPAGWLACDGAAVSRTTYAKLFAKVGTTFGAGDGFTTFNVPDYRGNAAAGADAMFGGASAGRLGLNHGQAGGSAIGYLTVENLPSHTHLISIGAAGQHTHDASTSFEGGHQHNGGITSADGLHQHTIKIWNREVAVSPGSGFGSETGNTDTDRATTAAGQHQHLVYLPVDGAHQHTVNVNGVGDHIHGASASYTGSGTPVSIVQPTLATNMIIWTGIWE